MARPAASSAPVSPVKRAHLVLLTVLGAAVAAWSFVLLRAQNAPESLERHLHAKGAAAPASGRRRSRCPCSA